MPSRHRDRRSPATRPHFCDPRVFVARWALLLLLSPRKVTFGIRFCIYISYCSHVQPLSSLPVHWYSFSGSSFLHGRPTAIRLERLINTRYTFSHPAYLQPRPHTRMAMLCLLSVYRTSRRHRSIGFVFSRRFNYGVYPSNVGTMKRQCETHTVSKSTVRPWHVYLDIFVGLDSRTQHAVYSPLSLW